MKITNEQKEALRHIHEQRCMHEDDTTIHGNRMNTLQYNGLVTKWNYANGSFYELTDKGLYAITTK